jgi:hypothetical protein
LCIKSDLENRSFLINFDEKIDSKLNWRILEDPFYLKLYNDSNNLKYVINIKMFNDEKNGKIVNDLSKVNFNEIEIILDKIRNKNVSIEYINSFKLENENDELSRELTYFNICKELESMYINKYDIFNPEKLNEKKKKDHKYDIFNPEKCRKNHFIIPIRPFPIRSIFNPFEKMLEMFDKQESQIFEEIDLSNNKSNDETVKYRSFKISKIFGEMLRSTVHDSMVLTQTKNKEFMNYLVNLWSVILNERESIENSYNENDINKDVSLFKII